MRYPFKTDLRKTFPANRCLYTSLLFSYILIFLANSKTNAQRQNITGDIIYSEIRFADSAKEKGIRYAFLNNLDASGLIVNGHDFINGITAYTKAEPNDEELLNWRPTFAYTNNRNDFGFTSGPYLYHADRAKDAIASGFYFSIWRKNSAGEYKVIFDGGVNHSAVTSKHKEMINQGFGGREYHLSQLKEPSRSAVQQKEIPDPLTATELLELESFFGDTCLILRPDQEFIIARSDYLRKAVKHKLAGIRKREVGYGSDLHHTMFYCYGNIIRRLAGGKEKTSGFYVTVWEKQTGVWKVIADIIQTDKN